MAKYLTINDSVCVEYESQSGLFFSAQVSISEYTDENEAKAAALALARQFEQEYLNEIAENGDKQ